MGTFTYDISTKGKGVLAQVLIQRECVNDKRGSGGPKSQNILGVFCEWPISLRTWPKCVVFDERFVGQFSDVFRFTLWFVDQNIGNIGNFHANIKL